MTTLYCPACKEPLHLCEGHIGERCAITDIIEDEPGYHGTMEMSRADADEIASWAKDTIVRERMKLLETAVRRIAETDTHGKNVRDEHGSLRPSGMDFCGRCNRNSFHPHADDCPIVLAISLTDVSLDSHSKESK